MTASLAAAAPNSPVIRLAWLLAAAGTLPFFGGIADRAMLGGHWLPAVQIYGAVIASFVAGIHWGAALMGPERFGPRLLAASNGAALIAWVAALLPPAPGFFILAALFPLLALIDRQLFQARLWPLWFWRLRATITALVTVACLFIAGLVIAARAGGAA